jgi:hypothetical protein
MDLERIFGTTVVVADAATTDLVALLEAARYLRPMPSSPTSSRLQRCLSSSTLSPTTHLLRPSWV